MKNNDKSPILLTMKMKSKAEKEKWKKHAREKHDLTLSALIRKLINDDIENKSPKVNPLLLEQEMKEMKIQIARMLEFLVNLRANFSEDTLSTKWSLEIIKNQVIRRIEAVILQRKKREKLVKEIEEIFKNEEKMLTP
ncbi:MAG: hypothetical protein ACTSVY_00895 [Candidatus Helarchaeota archaeon]